MAIHPLTGSSNITTLPMDPVVPLSSWSHVPVTVPDPAHSLLVPVLPSYPIVSPSDPEIYPTINGLFSDSPSSMIPTNMVVTHTSSNSLLSLSPSSSFSPSPSTIVSTVSSPNGTRPKLVLPMPEIPSRLDKRCKGGPGKRRKGISEEERQARRDERIIRNRIAAQESRVKKRAYVETLEMTTTELLESNDQLTKRVKILEEQNVTLNQKLDWVMTQLAVIKGTSSTSPINSFDLSTSIPVLSVPTTVCAPLCPSVSNLNHSSITLPNYNPPTMGNDISSLNNVISGSFYPQQTIAGCFDGFTLPTNNSITPLPIQSTTTFPLIPSHITTTTQSSSNPLSLSENYSSLSLNQPFFTPSVGFSGPAASGMLSFLTGRGNSLKWRPTIYLMQNCLQIMTITNISILTMYNIIMNIILTYWVIWVTLILEIVHSLALIHKLILKEMNYYQDLHVYLMTIPFTSLLLTRHYTLVRGSRWLTDSRPP